MPTVTIPLVGSVTERGPDGKSVVITNSKDQQFLNAIFRRRVNPATGAVQFRVEKRTGVATDHTPAAGALGKSSIETKLGNPTNNGFALISCFYTTGTGNANIYARYGGADNNLGTMTGYCKRFIQATFNGINYLCWVSSDGTGWYLAGDATFANTTGDVLNGSPVVSVIPSTTGFHVGQSIAGTGIPANARILTVDSGTQITINVNATATNTGVTISHNAISKIIDADFPSANAVGSFAYLDGYIFVATNTGQIYNCAINNPDSWSSGAFITANFYGNAGVIGGSIPQGTDLIRYRNYILCLKFESCEVFYNAGLATAPLGRVENAASKIGICNMSPAWAELDGRIYWLSQTEGQIAMFTMEGLTPKRVSTPDIENLLSTYLGGIPIVSAGYWDGVPVVMIADNVDVNTRILYQPDVGAWYVWSGTPIGVLTGGATTDHFTLDNVGTGGSVYKNTAISPGPYYQDSGVAISTVIRTSKIDHGTNKRKVVPTIRLMGADVQSTGTVLLEKSDDDYATWQTLGTFDLTKVNQSIHRCGSYLGGRAYRLTHSANGAFSAGALEVTYQEAA